MCGIAGQFSTNSLTAQDFAGLEKALDNMKHRGPDASQSFNQFQIHLGHVRLSIIDTSSEANQPMFSQDGNHILVFNGEIFNFQELKSRLVKDGVIFKTKSDSEVLLYHLIKFGIEGLNVVNGFFAFAYYNKINHQLLLARDRYGEKPLKYFYKDGKFSFASDLNALKEFLPYKKLNYTALSYYFRFNYIPAPHSIYQDVFKLLPGHYLQVDANGLKCESYYSLDVKDGDTRENINQKLRETLTDAVKVRMISDVPLGSFLSGGIDSTIITGLAKEINPNIQSFSIGFPDEPHFDETKFAKETAQFLGVKHEVFPVSGNKLIENFDAIIEKMDEPFADSSSLAVYELCKQTKKKITVALSGDGADEIFAGYHKHLAHKKSSRKNLSNFLIKGAAPLLSSKGSRKSKTGNKIRQIKKYGKGLKLNEKDRYIAWASHLEESELEKLFVNEQNHSLEKINHYFQNITETNNLNQILLSDIHLVLANDMLVKVDLMSMANSLEVRPPFLDYRIIELGMQINADEKIKGNSKKNILKTTFSDIIPKNLVERPKRGFEVPLNSWFNNELKNKIESFWLNENRIKNQHLFNVSYVEALKKNVFSNNSGNSDATVWAMIVFQEWILRNEIEL